MTVRKPPKFAAGELNVYQSPREVSDVTRALRQTGRRVMLVPTMGALHEGHLTLVRAAKRVQAAVVVVSIFVNPLQFGAERGPDKYPQTLKTTSRCCETRASRSRSRRRLHRCTRTGRAPRCTQARWERELEGASRPTHFAGVLTVVLKLLHIVRPGRAFFGEKDYQQLVLIRQMAADLNVDAEIVAYRSCANPTALRCRRATDISARPSANKQARCRPHCWPACMPHRAGRRRPWTPRARCSTRCLRSPSTT